MADFKILYLEHDDERVIFTQVMESIDGVKVDLLPYPEAEVLKTKIMQNRYDLIVTDANFLAEGISHHNNQDGEYLLSSIIKIVREMDSRVKIAVLTSYSPGLLSDHSDDLFHVDYLWDKTSTPGEFLSWQIKSLKRDIKREYPEYGILDRIDSLVGGSSFNHPWKCHLFNMVADYKYCKTEKDRLASIKKHFLALIEDLPIQTEFNLLYDSIVGVETLNIAGKPAAWGHLRHVVNVFWLGFYILNCGIVDKNKICSKLSLEKEADLDRAWLITSLFHDIGYLAEIADDIISACNKYSAIYPGRPIVFTGVNKDIGKLDHKSKFAILLSRVPSENAPLLTTIDDRILFDHGIISSLTVQSHFNKEKFSDINNIAAAAIAYHNLLPTKVTSEYNKSYNFDNFPIGTLLILCDLIQSWDRETGEETFMSKVPLEAVQLSRFDINIELKSIYIKINYIPFKYILPTDSLMRTIEETIRENIIKHVIPNLKAISMGSLGFKCDIDFVLDGRNDIVRCNIM